MIGVYSKLYFSKGHWSDFNKKQLDIAIRDFQNCQMKRKILF